MNHERNGKLLTVHGLAVLTRSGEPVRNGGFLPKRPDGGVVTQRTANPLSRADFRDSSQSGPFWSRIGFRGTDVPTANAAQAIGARSDEALQAAQPERRERGPKDAPVIASVIQGQSTGDVG